MKIQKYIKDSWYEFVWLPTQMKVLFIGLVFLIMFSISIIIKHKKNKPTSIEKAKIEVKKDSTELLKIQHEKDSINTAFYRNADSTVQLLYSKYRIEVLK